MLTPPLLETRALARSYATRSQQVTALRNATFSAAAGSVIAITGRSGSGKSTLLHLLGALDRPSSGQVLLDGCDLAGVSERQLLTLRRERLRFIFQAANLLEHLTAAQNIALPLRYAGLAAAEQARQAQAALELVGLAGRASSLPVELSGGEQQRVAVARALVPLHPSGQARDLASWRLLLADEPTGDLDRKSAEDVLQLLERLNREFKKTIVMVTHDPHAAERATSQYHLDKGVLTH